MPGASITILTPSDAQIDRLFTEISAGKTYEIQIVGSNRTIQSDSTQAITLLEANVGVINHASYGHKTVAVTYYKHRLPRPEDIPSGNYNFMKPDPVLSSIGIIYQGNNPVPEDVFLTLNLIINRFLVKETLLPGFTASEEAAVYSTRETALLSAIQGAAADQVARVDRLMTDLTSRFIDRDRELDEKTQQRREALEAEILTERQSLAAQAEELAAKQREMDDRDNTHVRRAIRGELIQALQKRQCD